jgi:prepilin-type N-terminal cleavage/methylation domain-containing protein
MRRAFTLIEMIIVLTVGSVLTGIAVSLLVVLLRAERSGSEHVENSTVIGCLADQFRRDVHAATKPPEINGHGIVRFASGGPVVQYTIDGRDVRREKIMADKSVGRREEYRLPKDWTAAVETDATTKPAIVRLTVGPQDAALRSAHEIRVEAVLGRDGRFAVLTAEEK